MRALGFLVLFLSAAFAADPPAAGSPEESVRESLRLIRDGKYEQWFADWCEPIRCQTQQQKDEMLRYGLARAHGGAKACLHGDDEHLVVTRWKGDPVKDAQVTVYIQCEEGRLPVPSTLTKVDGKWKVSSFSW